MKKLKYIKLRSRLNINDVVYTFVNWEPKEIDGVLFLPVVRNIPRPDLTQEVHYMRKDSLEKVK